MRCDFRVLNSVREELIYHQKPKSQRNITMRLTVHPTSRILMLVVYHLLGITSGEKLSPETRAPIYSEEGDGLRLEPPIVGPPRTYEYKPEKLRNIPKLAEIKENEFSFSFKAEETVQREHFSNLKLVDGSLVPDVKGRYSYISPEGLAIDVKYSADENGAISSFTFGTDPGRWQNDISPNIPVVPESEKLIKGKDYLPPLAQEKKLVNNYKPISTPLKKFSNDCTCRCRRNVF